MIIKKMMQVITHLKNAVVAWWNRDPFTQSAAVAYYTIFSFPALMILYFASASIFVSETELKDQTHRFLADTFGADAAVQFENIIQNTAPTDTSFWAFFIGGATLLFAALRLFMQLQKALNHIWGVNEDDLKGIKMIVIRRAVSFSVMLGIGFTLVVSLLLTSAISVLTEWLVNHLPDYFAVLFHSMNVGMLFLTITFMFTILLKNLPDTHVKWKHAARGGGLSALFFIFGEYMMGVYFGIAKPASAYGVTGSLILLMLWVSYSCVILLLGAELSKVLTLAEKKCNKEIAAHG